MPAFLTYLQSYFQGYQLPTAESAISPQKKDPRCACRHLCEDADQLTMLCRLFNGFPIDHEPPLCLPQDNNRLVASYHQLLLTGQVAFSVDHIDIDKNTLQKIELFTADVLSVSLTELLNEQGELQPEIINLLSLQKLQRHYQNDPAKLADIIASVVYGYASQLLLGAVTKTWEKNHKDFFTKNQISADKSGWLLIYIEKLLDRNSAFFRKHMETYIKHAQEKLFLETPKKLPYENCVIALKKENPDFIGKIVQTDLSTFMANKDWQREKLTFWLNIMAIFKEENDVTRVRSIFQELSQIIEQANFERKMLPPQEGEMYQQCKKLVSSPHAGTPLQDQKAQPQHSVAEWLNVRDNYYWIDDIVQRALHGSKQITSKEEHQLLKKLQDYKFDKLLIFSPPHYLLKQIRSETEITQNTSKLMALISATILPFTSDSKLSDRNFLSQSGKSTPAPSLTDSANAAKPKKS